MLKYAIKHKNNDVLIFHALPNVMTKFQWYISENVFEQGVPIDGQIYESYSLSAEIIKENTYVGKYLYCEYLATESNQYQKTEYIQLGLSIDSMINNGTIFDDISKFSEQGDIVKIHTQKPINKTITVTLNYNYTTDGEPIHKLEFDGVLCDVIGENISKREKEIFKLGIWAERERIWDESIDLVDDKIMKKLLRHTI
ncbi:hypothetical protein [Clostridium estertheticum]|uniref:hypothetical protein n=1 Tax=Clostridium estertheticum TaxID=238834 RepID=UPI001C0E8CB2|nr:hypothetical protein [Clostridium estertheticum]MBU3173354.1 hypothetical protein [Clostridium estertheticum]